MIRKFVSVMLLLFIAMSFVLHTAEAKRFGGGRSFGASRSASSFSRPTQNSYANVNKAQPNRSWLGPLAGLMAGGLLASLFMGHGFGGGIMTWLLVGVVLFFLVRWMKTKAQPQTIYRQQNASQPFRQQANSSFMNQSSTSNVHPIGFDENDFLRQAKLMFIRMQAAYDKKDLQDIREFTTPEVYAEIQLQCQERGSDNNVTHVVSVEAELLNTETEEHQDTGSNMQTPFASVRFSGLIQENANEPAAKFSEIWHFSKLPGNFRWLVSGLQQD